jgi:hypothetical protein
MCQLRRSRQWLARFYEAAPVIQSLYPTDCFLLLTVTVRNPKPVELRQTLQAMSQGWNRLRLANCFRAVRGFIRSSELTRSKDGSVHPHYHVLLQVRPSYFSTDYVTQADWVAAWRKAMRLDYDPIVDIRRVKLSKDAPEGLAPSIAGAVEVLKYTTKGSDLLADANWTDTVMSQTHRQRFIAAGGCWKNVLSDDPEQSLDPVDEVDAKETDPVFLWGWQMIARQYQSVGMSRASRKLAA